MRHPDQVPVKAPKAFILSSNLYSFVVPFFIHYWKTCNTGQKGRKICIVQVPERHFPWTIYPSNASPIFASQNPSFALASISKASGGTFHVPPRHRQRNIRRRRPCRRGSRGIPIGGSSLRPSRAPPSSSTRTSNRSFGWRPLEPTSRSRRSPSRLLCRRW